MSRSVRTADGDVVDRLVLQTYGFTAGATEAVLSANPGLVGMGPVLPAGLVVALPEVDTPAIAATVQLWD